MEKCFFALPEILHFATWFKALISIGILQLVRVLIVEAEYWGIDSAGGFLDFWGHSFSIIILCVLIQIFRPELWHRRSNELKVLGFLKHRLVEFRSLIRCFHSKASIVAVIRITLADILKLIHA